MNNDDFQRQILNAMRGGNTGQPQPLRGSVLAIIGIISICVTIIGSALAVSSQFSTFEGEMREWKRATDSRLTASDARAERDEQLLFERLRPVATP